MNPEGWNVEDFALSDDGIDCGGPARHKQSHSCKMSIAKNNNDSTYSSCERRSAASLSLDQSVVE